VRIPVGVDLRRANPVTTEGEYSDEQHTGVVPGPENPGLGDDLGPIEHGDRCAKNSRGYATGKRIDPCTATCGCRRAAVIGRGAYLVQFSGNSKIGRKGKRECSTTYASQETCPRTCPFLGSGCYGEGGKVAMAVLECNEACVDEYTCAMDECADIVKQGQGPGVLPPIRLHTVGDCRTERAAALLGRTCDAYIEEYKQSGRGKLPLKPDARPIWTYTYSWRFIPRVVWGNMSILASCNNLDEAAEAVRLGYKMCSLVVPENHFKQYPKEREIQHNGVALKLKPCLVQVMTHRMGAAEAGKQFACSTCQWCFQEHYAPFQGAVILLEVHGVKGDNIEMAKLVAAHAGL
jgi:hypothetical protein